ncbi:MAG: hypothetical protein JJ920_13295 [Roseitalea sp.]|nr:hypothetical protein [Roseitalea sp.]MBO6720735.1 hypothetical protein [Roseitalea sp.]MBO6743882.1 hypothetical protein [Roseitalea sp.]
MSDHSGRLVPLITAEQAFPAMEALVLAARQRLDLALHIFSPRTKTRSVDAHDRRLTDWGALLADALSRGVRVRFLLNDFDPVGAPDMHAAVWERIRHLENAVADLDDDLKDNLHMLVAHPGGQSGALLRTLVWPMARRQQRHAVRAFQAKGRTLPPGLAEGANAAFWPPRRNFTQTLHQKFLIADGERAILGGLDIDERRYDDPDHRRSAPETWHDVSVEIVGPAVARLAAHFQTCWTRVQTQGHSHAPAFMRAHPAQSIRFVPAAPAGAHGHDGAQQHDAGAVEVATTMSKPGWHPLRYGPRADVRDLEAAHLELFEQARHFVYLETQFFRSSATRDGLVAALGKRPDLHAIVLLPGAPDIIAYEGDDSGVHRYGEWLQMRALNRLTRLFPDRFAAFSLTNDLAREEAIERDALHNKSMVYVHSKVAVADDAAAIVSSANLNGRSMQWDVEAGIVARDADFAGTLREQLWRAHLGGEAATLEPATDPAGTFARWRHHALERSAAGARAKGTGVVPFPLHKTRRFAKRHLFIPEQMV